MCNGYPFMSSILSLWIYSDDANVIANVKLLHSIQWLSHFEAAIVLRTITITLALTLTSLLLGCLDIRCTISPNVDILNYFTLHWIASVNCYLFYIIKVYLLKFFTIFDVTYTNLWKVIWILFYKHSCLVVLSRIIQNS